MFPGGKLRPLVLFGLEALGIVVAGWATGGAPDREGFPAGSIDFWADSGVGGDVPKKRDNLLDDGEEVEQARTKALTTAPLTAQLAPMHRPGFLSGAGKSVPHLVS
jgi:hypothetical protein